MVYAPWELATGFNLATRLYLSEPSSVSDGEDVMRADVAAEGLWIFCACELLRDVVMQAIKQKPDVSDDTIVEGLKHYMENDDFMDYL